MFQELSVSRIKDYTFMWDEVLNFDGETGPYVQYTHARAASVLRNSGVDVSRLDPAAMDYSYLESDAAFELIKLLYRYPEVVLEAAEKYEPSVVTRHIVDIAQAFNKYYYEHRILDGEPAQAAARVALADATRQVIRTGLYLIGIEAPERM